MFERCFGVEGLLVCLHTEKMLLCFVFWIWCSIANEKFAWKFVENKWRTTKNMISAKFKQNRVKAQIECNCVPKWEIFGGLVRVSRTGMSGLYIEHVEQLENNVCHHFVGAVCLCILCYVNVYIQNAQRHKKVLLCVCSLFWFHYLSFSLSVCLFSDYLRIVFEVIVGWILVTIVRRWHRHQ